MEELKADDVVAVMGDLFQIGPGECAVCERLLSRLDEGLVPAHFVDDVRDALEHASVQMGLPESDPLILRIAQKVASLECVPPPTDEFRVGENDIDHAG